MIEHMFVSTGVDELTDWVSRLSVAPSSFEQVTEHTALASRLRGWVDAVLADLAVAAADYSACGLGAGVTAVIQDAARISAQEARTVVRRGILVSEAPVVGAALASGAISTAHADALAQVVAVVSHEASAALVERAGELVGEAEWLTPEDFRRRCVEASRAAEVDGGLSRFERQRKAAKLTRWTNKDTGMKCGRFELDPEWGEQVFRAFDAEIGRLFAEQATPAGESTEALLEHLGARALVNLVAHGQAARAVDAAVFVFTDVETVAHGPHEHTMCELSDGTPLPVGSM